MENFKPLLAAKTDGADLSTLRWPMMISPKLDGIRCVMIDGVATSRTLKAIPNKFVRHLMGGLRTGLDGELMTYTNGMPDDFNTIQSKVMRQEGEPDFKFEIFDCFTLAGGFKDRFNTLSNFFNGRGHNFVSIVPHHEVNSLKEATETVDAWLAKGYEGGMLRDPNGPYKFGRSTFREQTLLKIKRFEDDEARLIGVVELMHNENTAEKDNFGRTKRSTAKAGLVPAGTMGALQLRLPDGTEFEIGTGFTAEQRQDIWNRRDELLNSLVTFKFQGLGSLGRPRFPVFKGFRPELEAA